LETKHAQKNAITTATSKLIIESATRELNIHIQVGRKSLVMRADRQTDVLQGFTLQIRGFKSGKEYVKTWKNIPVFSFYNKQVYTGLTIVHLSRLKY